MNPSFDRAFSLTVGEEAGYVNDPTDPGGETKYGISKRAYPNEDIKDLTLDRAKELYYRDYWEPLWAGSLPWTVAYPLFDCAVNQGLEYAKTLLADHDPVEILSQRALRYSKNIHFDKYGHGWLRRLFTVYRNSLWDSTSPVSVQV
jgi:lysozyme family protein